jgi:hypothetical protein
MLNDLLCKVFKKDKVTVIDILKVVLLFVFIKLLSMIIVILEPYLTLHIISVLESPLINTMKIVASIVVGVVAGILVIVIGSFIISVIKYVTNLYKKTYKYLDKFTLAQTTNKNKKP